MKGAFWFYRIISFGRSNQKERNSICCFTMKSVITYDFFNHFIVLVCSLYVCILQKPAKLYISRIKVVFLVFFFITIACESNFNMFSLQPYVEKKQNFFCPSFFFFSFFQYELRIGNSKPRDQTELVYHCMERFYHFIELLY